MADWEKVKKGLENCLKGFDCPQECPYLHDCHDLMKPMFVELAKDAYDLLKEQEKKKFFVDSDGKITPLPDIVGKEEKMMGYREKTIDNFIKRVESTAEEDCFTQRTFYHLSSSMFHEMCDLMKEQEAVEPVESCIKDVLLCGSCKRSVMREEGYRFRHCPWCGKKVKWD